MPPIGHRFVLSIVAPLTIVFSRPRPREGIFEGIYPLSLYKKEKDQTCIQSLVLSYEGMLLFLINPN
jgi:hypothetical protein